MFTYHFYQSKAKNATKGLWYPQIHYDRTLSTRELAEHMAIHNSGHSAAAIEGVLLDMISCIKELLADGNKVKIPDLALFQYNIKSRGSADVKTFTPANSIVGVRLRARGTGASKSSRDMNGSLGVKITEGSFRAAEKYKNKKTHVEELETQKP